MKCKSNRLTKVKLQDKISKEILQVFRDTNIKQNDGITEQMLAVVLEKMLYIESHEKR